ncbi:hypothetical protein HK096_003414, partial [Nowakowskiella sp. JEL0078]
MSFEMKHTGSLYVEKRLLSKIIKQILPQHRSIILPLFINFRDFVAERKQLSSQSVKFSFKLLWRYIHNRLKKSTASSLPRNFKIKTNALNLRSQSQFHLLSNYHSTPFRCLESKSTISTSRNFSKYFSDTDFSFSEDTQSPTFPNFPSIFSVKIRPPSRFSRLKRENIPEAPSTPADFTEINPSQYEKSRKENLELFIKTLQDPVDSNNKCWQYYESLARQRTIHSDSRGRSVEFLSDLSDESVLKLLRNLKVVNDSTRNYEIPQAIRFLDDMVSAKRPVFLDIFHSILEVYLWRCHKSAPETLNFIRAIAGRNFVYRDEDMKFPDFNSMLIVLKAASTRMHKGEVDLVYQDIRGYKIAVTASEIAEIMYTHRKSNNAIEALRLIVEQSVEESSSDTEPHTLTYRIQLPFSISQKFNINSEIIEHLVLVCGKNGWIEKLNPIMQSWAIEMKEDAYVSAKTYNSILDGLLKTDNFDVAMEWFNDWVNGTPKLPVKENIINDIPTNDKSCINSEYHGDKILEQLNSPIKLVTVNPDIASYTIVLQHALPKRAKKIPGTPGQSIHNEVSSIIAGAKLIPDDIFCSVLMGFFVEYGSFEFADLIFKRWIENRKTETQNSAKQLKTSSIIYGIMLKALILKNDTPRVYEIFDSLYNNTKTRTVLQQREFVSHLLEACVKTKNYYLAIQLANSFHYSRLTNRALVSKSSATSRTSEINDITLSSIVSQYYILQKGRDIGDFLVTSDTLSRSANQLPLKLDGHINSILLQSFAKTNNIETATQMYSQLIRQRIRPTIPILNQMVYLYRRRPRVALQLFDNAVTQFGIQPDSCLYANILRRVRIKSDSVTGIKRTIVRNSEGETWDEREESIWIRRIFDQMKEQGVNYDLEIFNFLLHKYGSLGAVNVCNEIFDMMKEQGIEMDLKSWNLRLKCFAVSFKQQRTLSQSNANSLKDIGGQKPSNIPLLKIFENFDLIFKEMLNSGFVPDRWTFEFVGLALFSYSGSGFGLRRQWAERRFWMIVELLRKKDWKPTSLFQSLFTKFCLKSKAEMMSIQMWNCIGFHVPSEIVSKPKFEKISQEVMKENYLGVRELIKELGLDFDLEPDESDYEDNIGLFIR